MYDYDEEWNDDDYRARDEIWTVKMVCERWKCSPSKVCELLAKGELKGFKIGYTWRTYLGEVLKFEKQDAPADHKRAHPSNIAPMPKAVITRIT